MREKKRRQPMAALARYALGVAGLALGLGVQAASVRIDVVDGDGNPVSGFKYIVQEDTTFPLDPANPPPIDQMLTFGFHTSNHPPAVTEGIGVSGRSDRSRTRVTLNPGRYFVSVLPYYGHGMSGAPIVVGDTDPAPVKVIVEKNPIPTAQISVFLFQDKYPLNNAPDLPQEANPAPGDPGHVDWTQFTVILEEPAGRYGQNGGPVIQDAFGNPLGTTYLRTCDAQGEADLDPITNYGCLNGGLPVVVALGDGTLHPDSTGNLLIQNLPPGKYGIKVTPPVATPVWQQVTTIEGTKVIDAWVKANEPPWFQEFGAVFPHIFMGFVQPFNDMGPGVADVSGTVVDTHLGRPPNFTSNTGRDFPSCWVALNDAEGPLTGQAVYAQPCDTNGGSGFRIPSVPVGTYNLVLWDTNLDMIIAFQNITVDEGGTCPGAIAGGCDFGEIPVLNWFARLNTAVFNDTNQNGFWDAGEGVVGPEGGPVAIRWRDGTIYQTFPTDTEGRAPFDEVFPFFHWLVAEVGFGNKKATGATFVVDAGGEINPNTGEFPDYGELQPLTNSLPACDPLLGPTTECTYTGGTSRTETGPVLTQAFQHFQGQTNVLEFGKAEYLDFDKTVGADPVFWKFVGENGGISGIVHYGVTRAEDDPRFAAAETWEPGIPRVQMALYADGDIDCNLSGGAAWPNDACDIDWNGDGIRQANDGVIDSLDNGVDSDGDGNPFDLADVDNYPLGWADGGTMGPEDVDRNVNGTFDLGDALQVAWTDSWDDNLPIDCEGQNLLTAIGIADDRCFDGFRNWNQVRPGVFDGGYAFSDYNLEHLGFPAPLTIGTKLNAFYVDRNAGAYGATLPDAWLLPADYIVQMAVPPGYELVKEEDKNVDFGEAWIPSPQAVDPVCVGDLRRVPPYLSFATTDGSGLPNRLIAEYAADPEAVAAPYARELRALCDRKAVPLSTAQNAAANFFVMTDVPIAANASGLVNDDLNNEFNPNSPGFGEKVTLPFIPIAFYDWNEQPVHRVYTDRFGRYNAVLPSSYSANLPMPSGWSPNMLVTCINDAGPIPNPDPTGPALIIDPYFNPNYYQACYTWQFMPGVTTYLDTPTIPVAAFSNPQSFPADCEQATGTPVVARVARISASRPVGAPTGLTGPFVVAGGTVGADQRIRIDSMGTTTVPDPAWDGSTATPRTIERDYGFGASGTAHLEAANGARTPLVTPTWSDATIVARVPAGLAPGEYQVVVTRDNGAAGLAESPVGVTLTVGICDTPSPTQQCAGTEFGVNPDGITTYAVHSVSPAPYPFTPIQDAITAATPGDLILVSPGSYEELVVMHKPVKLQGWGQGATFLNARSIPTEKTVAWRDRVEALVELGDISPLPGQIAPLFQTEEGAGIFVAGKDPGPDENNPDPASFAAHPGARIDGFHVLGSTSGGAIVLNGYAAEMSLGNNRITANAGAYGGGIRLGHPTLVDGLDYPHAHNENALVHHNLVVKNGGTSELGVGGGVSLNRGADGYRVQHNWVCGNYNVGSGAGIGHFGRSNGGWIQDNTIVFNESFSQSTPESGGGIYVGGQPALQAEPITGLLLSAGTGTVRIDSNLIRGNLAGAGDGGGIRIENVNGVDIANNLDNSNPWYDVYVTNNMITNNVSGLAGGGISLANAVSVFMNYNTVANNDSVSTTALAGTAGVPNITNPHPAGIVSYAHSTDFALLMSDVTAGVPTDWLTFSDPELYGDIVYQNRSFFWLADLEIGLFPASCYPNVCDPLAELVDDYTDDLAVLGTGGLLDPRQSVLSLATTGYDASNTLGDPSFVNPYFNGPRDPSLPGTTIQSAGAFDEGGNFIQVTYGPLTLGSFDYHIGDGSVAIDAGGTPSAGGPLGGLQRLDYDDESRPQGVAADSGADERQ